MRLLRSRHRATFSVFVRLEALETAQNFRSSPLLILGLPENANVSRMGDNLPNLPPDRSRTRCLRCLSTLDTGAVSTTISGGYNRSAAVS